MNRQATIALVSSSSIRGTMRAEKIPLLMFKMLTGSSSSWKSKTVNSPFTVIFKEFLLM